MVSMCEVHEVSGTDEIRKDMTREELKSRIDRLSLPQISHMSYKNFAILTDNFCEELIFKLITKVDSNELQRKMYEIIVEKYTDWCFSRGIGRPFISYPDYISTIDFKLECGDVIIDESSRIIGTLDDLPRGEEVNDLEEQEERIAKLESENAKLRTEIEKLSKSLTWNSDEDFVEEDDYTDSLQQQNEELMKELKQQKEEAQKRIKELETHVEGLQQELKGKNREHQWIACFDGFLHPNLNAQAIAHALEGISSPQLPKNERGYWWTFYTVLTEINWIPSKNHKMALQWANLHFNCGWDWSKDNQFKFSDINNTIKTKGSSGKSVGNLQINGK